MRIRALPLLAAGLLGLLGCGDGSSWVETVEAGCAEWNERYAHLEVRDLDTVEDAVQHTREVAEFAEGLLSDIEEAGGADDPGPLEAAYRDLADATRELAAATRERRSDAVEAATERISEIGDRINALAEDLDVPACGGY